MRKITMMVGVALSAGLLLTNCVKNEEADGVKALREAQAELILAKAGAATSAAADATTLANATAAISNATAAQIEANVAKLVLENELLAAENDLDKAKIQLQIDQLAAQSEYALNTAIAEANTEMVEAQQQLADALTELAKSEAAKQGEYYDNYVEALEDLEDAQEDVYEDKVDIAEATYYVGGTGSTDDFVSYITNKKDITELQIERIQNWYDVAKTIVETASGDNAEAITAAQAEFSSLEDQIEDKEIEAQGYDAAYELAFEEMEQAYYAYENALTVQSAVEFFDTEYDEEDILLPSSVTSSVDAEFLEEYNNIPSWNENWGDVDADASVGFGADGYYATIAYQEYRIAMFEGYIEDYETTIDKVTDLYNTYHVELDELYDTYVEEEAKLPELLHAWNVAEIDAEAHPDDAAKQTANEEAEEAYTDQADIVSEAWNDYVEFLENVDDAEILNGTGYYAWIGNASVNGGADDGDTNHADILEYMTTYESAVEMYEAQIEMYEEVIDLLEAYITWLGTEDVDAYQTAYFTAKETWETAQTNYDTVQDEIEILDEQLESVEELLSLLIEDDATGLIQDVLYEELEEIAAELDELEEELAGYEIALTDADAYLVYLNQKLANDEAIVEEATALVATTKDALDAELGAGE